MDYTQDTELYSKVTELMDKLEKNQQLQQLAYENGIDTKNTVKLTAATKENIAVSVVALLLAKRNGDSRYRDLVRYGMDHRKTKMDIINDYKTDANALITRYKNGERPNETVTITTISTDQPVEEFYDASIFDCDIDSYMESYIQEGAVGRFAKAAVLTAIALPFVLIATALGLIVRIIDSFIGIFTRISPERLLKKIKRLSPEKKAAFTFVLEDCDPNILKVDSDTFVELVVDMREFGDMCEDALTSGDKVGKTVRKAAAELMQKLHQIPYMRSFERDSDTRYHMTYEETVELLTDLSRFNLREVQTQMKRMKKLISKFEATGKEQSYAGEGFTKTDQKAVREYLTEYTVVVQLWARSRDRILRKSDIVIDKILSGITSNTRELQNLADDVHKMNNREEIKQTEHIASEYMKLRRTMGASQARDELKRQFPHLSNAALAGIVSGVENHPAFKNHLTDAEWDAQEKARIDKLTDEAENLVNVMGIGEGYQTKRELKRLREKVAELSSSKFTDKKRLKALEEQLRWFESEII